MKIIFLIMTLLAASFAQSVDCTQIFESRKGELLREVEKIDDARQSFEALKAATNALFDKQRASIEADRKALVQKEADLNATQQNIKALIAKNQKILDEIKGIKESKISQTYTKMKDSAAAAILDSLTTEEASRILFTLQAKKISKILAKMNPLNASKVTIRLSEGPPFQKSTQKQIPAQNTKSP
ncbi:MotE family protein [Sulfurospirillum sp. 1612]|uniref:MotE family protein n=1 Tax=Sulfurospirillum sp. 1612 TaxID=3094835 RepID=UPI002F92D594